eukprot:403352120
MEALICKKKLNGFSFYGRKLNVQYEPDLERLEDTKDKMEFRFQRVNQRLSELKHQQKRLTKEEKQQQIDQEIINEVQQVDKILKQSKSFKQQEYEYKQYQQENKNKMEVIDKKNAIRNQNKRFQNRVNSGMKKRIKL